MPGFPLEAFFVISCLGTRYCKPCPLPFALCLLLPAPSPFLSPFLYRPLFVVDLFSSQTFQMSNSRTMKVAVLALVATMGGAFVTPGPRASVSGAGAGADKTWVSRSPTSRGDTSAVSSLNMAGFSLSDITDIFTRKKSAKYLRLVARVARDSMRCTPIVHR